MLEIVALLMVILSAALAAVNGWLIQSAYRLGRRHGVIEGRLMQQVDDLEAESVNDSN